MGGVLQVDGTTYSDYESAVGQMPISGLVDVCAVNTVTDSQGIVLRPCMFFESAGHVLYAIEEVTGKSRFISAWRSPRMLHGLCAAGVNNHTANDYYPEFQHSIAWIDSSLPILVTGWVAAARIPPATLRDRGSIVQPTGAGSCPSDWQEITIANSPSYPRNNNIAEINVTPKVDPQGKDQTPVRQMVNYNAAQMARHPEIPVFDPARWFVNIGGVPTDQTKGWFAVQFVAQNFMSWVGFFDPASNFNLVAMNNSYSKLQPWPVLRYPWDEGSSRRIRSVSAVLLPVGSGPGAGRFVLQSNTSARTTPRKARLLRYRGFVTSPVSTANRGASDLTLAGPDLPCHDTPNSFHRN